MPSVFLNIWLLISHRTDTGVPVVGVIDGDTIVVGEKTRLRLRQVDAPETGFCGSSEAANALTALVSKKRVRIEEQIPDQHGRGMALVYMGDTLINEVLLDQGLVRYHSDNTSQTKNLIKVYEKAKKDKRGIWGACQSTENRENPNCIIKGNIDKSTDTHIYYTPDCAQYPFTVVEKDIGETWFCTEKEAKKAGYIKAATCTK